MGCRASCVRRSVPGEWYRAHPAPARMMAGYRRAGQTRVYGPSHWLTNGGGPVTEPEATPSDPDQQAADEAQLALLAEENAHLRSRLADTPNRVRALEERLLETKGQLAQKSAQNEKLSYTLREAREHIAALRDEVDKLTQPPSAYGTYLGTNDDGSVDVYSGGR